MKKSLVRQWLQLSAVWFFVAIVPVGRAWLFDFYDLWFYVLILVSGFLLAPLLIMWISWLQQRGRSWFFIVLIHVCLAIGLSTIHHYLTVIPKGETRMRVSQQQLEEMNTSNLLTFYALTGSTYSVFTSFFMFSAIGLLIVYNEQARQRGVRESLLRESLARAQVKVLQSELQPHFIFNTLHSVNSLMETDVEKAQDLIERFSFLMRHYLAVIERQFYSVNDEVSFLTEYVSVLQYRYSRLISFQTSITNDCLEKNIPVILLQPVVENCIKHSSGNNELIIELNCRMAGEKMTLTVKDNGLNPPDNPSHAGVGLRNLQERLSIIYGNEYSYSADFNNGHTTTISLPAR